MRKELLIMIILVSCGDPEKYLDEELKKVGYIRYVTPMKELGTGTLVGGTPKNLEFVSGSQSCFPDFVNSDNKIIPTDLRLRDDTTLPIKNQKLFFSNDGFIRLFEIIKAGNLAIKAGYHIDEVKNIQLEMSGIHIEFMDSIKLSQFYFSPYLGDVCKNYLDHVAFIIQALKVDHLKFVFYKQDGGHFDITVENIENFIDVSESANWRIENNTTLIFDTPFYLGYQLGALRHQDNGVVLLRASGSKNGQFNFTPVGVFDDDGSK